MSGRRLRKGKVARFDDSAQDESHRDHRERLDELQSLPFVNARLLSSVALPDSTVVTLRHGLGKAPSAVFLSVPSGATASGRVIELRDTNGSERIDRDQYIVLEAFGYGATVRVDVLVVP